MKVNTNPDFKKWVTTLTQDRKKYNFNKVFRVLSRVDKVDRFRHCVKQLATNWQVPLTRLTEEQLSRYSRESTQAKNIESASASESLDEEENWSVLNECGGNDVGQDPNIGKAVPKSEPLPGSSLDNSTQIYNVENINSGSNKNNDLVNLKLSGENTESKDSNENISVVEKSENKCPERDPLPESTQTIPDGRNNFEESINSNDLITLNECHEKTQVEHSEVFVNLSKNDSLFDDSPVVRGYDDNCLSNNSDNVNNNKVHTINAIQVGVDSREAKQISRKEKDDDNSIDGYSEKNPYVTSSKSDIINGEQLNTDNVKEVKTKLKIPSIENNQVLVIKSEVEDLSHDTENNNLFGTSLNKSSSCDALKHTNCPEGSSRIKPSLAEYNCDSNDLESEMRKLHEVLIFSEKDGTADETQSSTNTNDIHFTDVHQHTKTSQSPISNKASENIEHAEDKSERIHIEIDSFTNIDHENVTVSAHCKDSKEKDVPSSKINHAFSDHGQCERDSVEGKDSQTDGFLNLEMSSDSGKNSNQNLTFDVMRNNDKAETTSQSSNCVSNICHEKSHPRDKAFFHQSQSEKCNLKGKVDSTVTKSSSPSNVLQKPEKYSGENNHTRSKDFDLPVEKDELKIDLQSCTQNGSRCTPYKYNIATENMNKVINYDSHNATPFSCDEKNFVQRWWTKYQTYFERKEYSSYFHCERTILDYENENWPEISKEMDEIQCDPKKLQIDSLLNEMKKLEQEKYLISTLQETTSDSESAAELSDDDDISLVPESSVDPLLKTQFNQEEETIYSNSISPVVTVFDTVNAINENKMPTQPPLPSYSPPRTPPPPPLLPSPSKALHLSRPPSPLSSSSSSSSLTPPYFQKRPSIKKIFDFPLPPFAAELLRSQKSHKNNNFNSSDSLSSDLTSPDLTKRLYCKSMKKSVSSAESERFSSCTPLYVSSASTQKQDSNFSTLPTADKTLENSKTERLTVLNTEQLEEISQTSLAPSKPLSSLSKSESCKAFDYVLQKIDLHSGDESEFNKLPLELKSTTKDNFFQKSLQLSDEATSEMVSIKEKLSSSLGSIESKTKKTFQKSESKSILYSPKPADPGCIKSPSSILFQSSLFPKATSLVMSQCHQKSKSENFSYPVKKQKACIATKKPEKLNDQLLNEKNLFLCRKNLREGNLHILNNWNTKERYVPLKKHSKKAKRLKFCRVNSSKAKKTIKKKSYLKRKTSIKVNNLSGTNLEISSNIDNSQELSEEVLKQMEKTEIPVEENTSLKSSIKEKVCGINDIQEVSENYGDVTKCLVSNQKEETCQYSLTDSVTKSEEKTPQCHEELTISEMKIEDDESNQHQFVDESVPGNPIAFNYVEEEEDINIYFMENSSNLADSDVQADCTKVSASSSGLNIVSPMKYEERDVSSHSNEESLLNDLQVSSSDDDSEEESYTRPRIINGFGVPFVLPPNDDKIKFTITEENVTTVSSLIKIEGSEKYFQDNDEPSNTFHDEPPSITLSETSQPPSKTKFPIIIEAKSIKSKEYCPLEMNTTKTKDKNKSKKSSKSERNLKEKNRSSKPRKLCKTSIDSFDKESKSFHAHRHPCDSREKIKKNKINELKVISSNKLADIDVTRRKSKIEKSECFKINSVKSKFRQNKTLGSSSFPLSTGSPATTKNDSTMSNITQKEKPSYQPSSIRKRLTSEVETIILIKKDLVKPTKSKLSTRNKTKPLKRSFSIPQTSSEKICNPVVDDILKGMGNSPPPKTLLKEQETCKYFALPYWCHPDSSYINQSQINDREIKDKDPQQFLSPDCDKRHKRNEDVRKENDEIWKVKERSSECNITLKRAISLNTGEIYVKEKEKIQLLKIKNTHSFKRHMNKKPSIAKKKSKHKNNTQSVSCLNKEEQTTTKENPVSTQDVFHLKKRIKGRKLSESLPSMPLIECESVLEISDASQVDTQCIEVSSKISTKISQPINSFVSSVDINNLCMKVSIPISHLSTDFLEYLSPAERIQTNQDNDLDRISGHVIGYNKKCDKVSANITNNRDLQSSLIVENERNNVQNKKELRKEIYPQTLPDINSPLTVAITNLNTSNPRNVNDSEPQVVKDIEPQSKTNENETSQHIRGLKRYSSEPGSGSQSKKNKYSPKRRNSSKEQLESSPSSVFPKSVTSQKNVFNKDPVLEEMDMRAEIPQTSEHIKPSGTNTSGSISHNEEAIKILDHLANNNNLQISSQHQKITVNPQIESCSSLNTKLPQENISNHDPIERESSITHEAPSCETSKLTRRNDQRRTVSSTLRVKHPSLLQTNTTGELTPQKLPNDTQSSNQENKRPTWYVEPERISNTASTLSIEDKDIGNDGKKSFFHNLSDEPNKKLELLSVFQKSVKIRKKEYDQIHDLIKCIDFDCKEKQSFIDSVKKLTSIEVVQKEIKRVTKEYENKLVERESFLHQSLTLILDHFKDATDYVYLAFYVFLSAKVIYLCREDLLKQSLLKLFKTWIRSDTNKHIFDQCDSAFNNDYEVVFGILRQMRNFHLLLTGDDQPTLSQNPMDGCEVQHVDIPVRCSNVHRDKTILHETAAVEIIELDCSRDFVTDNSNHQPPILDDSQATAQSQSTLDLGQNANSEEEYPANEYFNSKSASKSNNSNLVGNQIQKQSQIISSNMDQSLENREQEELFSSELQSTPSKSCTFPAENQQIGLYSRAIESEPIIRSQELIHQKALSQPGISNDSSQCVTSQRTPPLQTQFVSQTNSLDFNNLNGISYGQNNCIPQSSSNFNVNTVTQYPRHKTQQEVSTKNHVPNPKVFQTNHYVYDKYRSMRQSKTQHHDTIMIDLSAEESDTLTTSKECPNLRKMLVQNHYSVPFAQNIAHYGSSVHSGVSEPAVAPSVQSTHPHLQNVRGMKVLVQNPPTLQTQPTYHHKTSEALQPLPNQYPVYSPDCQRSEHLRVKDNVQKNTPKSHNLVREINMNCGFPNAVANTQYMQHFQTNPSDKSIDKKIQSQRNCRRRPSQELLCQQQVLRNQFEPVTGFSQNFVAKNFPKTQNTSHQVPNPQINTAPPSYNSTHHVINAVPTANLTHLSSQMHGQLSIDNASIKLQQPMNQSLNVVEHARKQHPYQQHVNSRRASVETALPSQQTGKPSPTQFKNTTVLAQEKTCQSTANYPQIKRAYHSVPLNSIPLQSSGAIQSIEKQQEMLEGPDLDCITETDLNNLFNMVDSEKIMEIMENIKNNDYMTNQNHLNRNRNPNNPSAAVGTSHSYDESKRIALSNIDNNLQILAKVPDVELIFNGVHINKQQLWKFSNVCREQVSFAGLREDQQTTFIGRYTVDGRTFTEEEVTSLMRGIITMNARKITTVRISEEEKGKRSKQYLIQTLRDTACKDVASYLRIVNMLRSLAAANDQDAQQAVREIAGILSLIKPK